MTNNPNPFDEMFDQIADMLAMAEKHKGTPLKGEPMEDGIEKQVDELEKQVEFFRKVTEEAMKMSGLKDKDLEETIENPTRDLDPKERRALQRARELKKRVVDMELEYARMTKIAKLHKRKAKTEGTKRKKKFKRLGGQGWMPL